MESYSTGALALTPSLQDALNWCQKYALEPLVVAAYGPPSAPIATLTVTADVVSGAYVIPVSGTAGLPSNSGGVDAPIHACHVGRSSDNAQIVSVGKWGPAGALIDAVDTGAGTITLAAKTNVALSADTVLTVNQLRYASAATQSGTEASWIAYARYAKFLADQIGALGLKGRVELWNEPAWQDDPWAHRQSFYDTTPSGVTARSPNFGMLHAVLDHTLPATVRYSWGGSHKSGTGSVFSDSSGLPAATQVQVAATVSSEGTHPYGSTSRGRRCLSTSRVRR